MKIKGMTRTIKALLLDKIAKSRGNGALISQKISSQGYLSAHSGVGSGKKRIIARFLAKRPKQWLRATSPCPQKEGKRKWARVRIPLVALILVVLSYGLLQGPFRTVLDGVQPFRIHEVQISGCVMTSTNELRKFADISYELNMLTLDPEQIKRKLLAHPWIAKAALRRIWPDRLAITVTEYRPVAMVSGGAGEKDGLRYMDRKGSIFAKVRPGQDLDFPVITGLYKVTAECDKKEMLAAVSLFLRLASHNNPNLPAQDVSEIHIDQDGGLILYLVEQPFPIIFGKGKGKGEVRRKFTQLREVLAELYRKKRGKAIIENVAYIRMDYQANKVLVAKKNAGKRHG